MISPYIESIYSYVKQKLSEQTGLGNFLYEDRQDFSKKFFKQGDWSMLPCAITDYSFAYKIDDNIDMYPLDFTKELPGEMCVYFYVYSEEISDVVEIEKYISDIFSSSVNLQANNPHNKDGTVPFTVYFDREYKIVRETKDFNILGSSKKTLRTILRLKIDNVLIFHKDFHPAEVSFDRQIQLELAERAGALERIIEKQGQISELHLSQAKQAFTALVTMLGVDLPQGITYLSVFNAMEQNRCDLATAIANCAAIISKEREEKKQLEDEEALRAAEERRKLEQQRREEENRIRRINQMLSACGDPAANRYVDKVVEDVKNRIQIGNPIAVYGGTTFTECLRKKALGALEDASLLIKDEVVFPKSQKTYLVTNAEGSRITRNCTTEVLPMAIGFTIDIYARSIAVREKIKESFIANYSKPVAVKVGLPDGNFLSVGILFKEDKAGRDKAAQQGLGMNFGGLRATPFGTFSQSKISEQKETTDADGFYTDTLYCQRYQAAYFVADSVHTEKTNNPKLLINLFRLAIFYGENSVKLSSASQHMNAQYRQMIDGELSLYHRINSANFRELVNCYKNGQPLDESKFNDVFSNIVDIYPSLYSKTVQGWSFDQIKSDIDQYAALFDQRFVDIYTSIGVPQEFKRLIYTPPFSYGQYPFSFDNLKRYATMLEKDMTLTVQELVDNLENEMLEILKEERKERAEQATYQGASSNDSYSSEPSGGGFLSSMVRQGVESVNIKRHAGKTGKRDLIGQAGCAKTYGGKCDECSLRMSCSRYFF